MTMLSPSHDLCARHRVHDARLNLEDARRRRDPTQTYFLRARMRAEGDRRWRLLAQTLRQALTEHDLVGQRGVGRLPHGNKTEGFAAWIREELRQKVLGYDGGWLRPYVRQAAATAQKRAAGLAPGGDVDPRRVATMESLAASELRGIVEAAQQQLTREVTHALVSNLTPHRTSNGCAGVIRRMRQRTRAMSEYVVAKTHATSTLSAFRAAGVTSVGIDPERVRRRGATRDAKPPIEEDPDYEEVDVQTADDDDVCVVCQDISEGGPYELNDAEDLIPAHAWCRCAFVPAGTLQDALLDWDPDQPRDPDGRWGTGRGGSQGEQEKDAAVHRKIAKESLSSPLTKSETSAVERYTGHDYHIMNGVLRGSKDPAILSHLDSVRKGSYGQHKGYDPLARPTLDLQNAINKSSLSRPLDGYRHVSKEMLDKLRGLKNGSTFTDKGFVSMTSSRDWLEPTKTTKAGGLLGGVDTGGIVEVHVARGARALPVAHISGTSTGEREVILHTGSKFEVYNHKGVTHLTLLN